MARQAQGQADRELRQLFMELSDRAIRLATSIQKCGCDPNTQATDSRGLNEMVQDLRAARQTIAGHIGGPPSHEASSVDDPNDEALKTALDKHEEQPPARAPLTLMSLPSEIRNMIWWATLAPKGGFVPIVHWDLNRPRAGTPHTRNSWLRPGRFVVKIPPRLRYSYEREGEHRNRDAGWALVRVSREVRDEAENEYWRRAIADGLMFSFTCHHFQRNYHGIASAWAFLNDCSERYLHAIRRLHLDLRRTGYYDLGHHRQAVAQERHINGSTNLAELLDPLLDLLGTRLVGLRYLSLTFSGWVPDVRQTPWDEYPPAPIDLEVAQSSKHWVTRLQNIRGLTRLRLRVVIAPANAVTFLNLPRDPGVLRTVHFLSMLRGSMLINGDALGVASMSVWSNQCDPFQGESYSNRVIVQCDDSWDEDSNKHIHRVGDDGFDPLGGSKLHRYFA